MVVAGRLVIASLHEQTLRQALDRYDDKKINLQENYFYGELSEKYRKSKLFCYFSVAGISKQFQYLFEKESIKNSLISRYLSKLKGFTAGGYGYDQQSGYTHSILTLHFNKYELNKRTAALLSIKPEYNRNILKTPADSLLYYWTNTLDLDALWDTYIRKVESTAAASADIEETVAASAEMSFESLLALAGNSFQVMIHEPATIDFVPVPNFNIALSLQDTDKAMAAFYALFKNSSVPHKNDIYRGVLYTYWGKEMQKGLQPVFTFYKDALYVSSSIAMQRKTIDTILDGNGIAESKGFKQHAKDLMLLNNSVAYAEMPGLLDTVEELVHWSGVIMGLQNSKTAYMSRKVIDGLILPLIEGLKNRYSVFAGRSYFEESRLIMETRLILSAENQ
ncbi:MAG: hypothetical protein V2I36_01095 [Desulfopila sp.]|nr:hypothetical protein [Desulfopila sp.]